MLYKLNINDPGLTLKYFTKRSNLVAYMFEWVKLLPSHLYEKKYSSGLSAPTPGLYICL